MKKMIKVLVCIVLVLIGLMGIALVAVFAISSNKANRTYAINPEPVVIPTDAASIKEGRRLATIRGCMGCHTDDLGGDPRFITGPFADLGAPNLTQGKGSETIGFTDQDWLRAIRHGVGKDGKGLWIMPSNEFYQFSDADVGKIIAYIKSVPPVDREANAHELGFLGRVLLAINQVGLIPAEEIPHTQKATAPTEAAVTADYGRYMAISCSGCHNANFSGGPSPDGPPDAPPAANLTQVVKGYDEAQFMEFFHSGKSVSGRTVPKDAMPWDVFGNNLTETEMKALYAYLKTLPVRETGQ